MSKKSFINSIEVQSPCSEAWDEMSGNELVRFCSHCSKNVNNLSEMTRKEAMRLVRASNGKLCVRYITHPKTQRPMFAEQLLQITRRAPGLAAGVMTASIALSGYSYAQGDPAPVNRPGFEMPAVAKADPPTDTTGRLAGTVVDQHGAIVVNAAVSIFSVDAARSARTVTDENGVYRFDGLQKGKYRVEIESEGFAKSVKETTVAEGAEARLDVEMTIAVALTVDVRAGVDVTVGTMGLMISRETYSYSSALARAVANDDLDEARQLIIRGHHVEGREKDHDKITPLFIAVENGNVEMAQLLLSFRARVNARDGSKQTPIMRLDEDATPEMVELLVRYGAKVDAVDQEGNTPLTLAAASANADVLKTLIDAGAEVRAANKTGRTALMNAAENDDLEAVRLLLESGSEVNARDDEGDSAWDLTSNDEIEELLETYGAETRVTDETDSSEEPLTVTAY